MTNLDHAVPQSSPRVSRTRRWREFGQTYGALLSLILLLLFNLPSMCQYLTLMLAIHLQP